MSFRIGETVICTVYIKDSSGVLQDPSTSMNIGITTKSGIATVNATAMTRQEKGIYFYDLATSNLTSGDYIAHYIATDGSRISILDNTFTIY